MSEIDVRPEGPGEQRAAKAVPADGTVAAQECGQRASYALRFRPPPLLPWAALQRWAVVVAVALGTAVGLGRRLELRFIGENTLDWLLGGAAALLALLAALLRGKQRGARTPPIELFEGHLSVPKSETSKHSDRISYRDLLSLELIGPSLVLGAHSRLYVYPLASLEQPDQAQELRSQVHGFIARTSGGLELLDALRRREALGAAFRTRAIPVTQVLLLILLAVFALEHLSGALSEPFGLLRWGANVPLLVAGGHLELLVSAGFLHLGFLHLVVNSASLLVLGMILERMLGSLRFALIYLCGSVAGAACSALLSSTLLSVGASSAVFGLLGSLALLELRFGTGLPAGFRQPPLRWAFLLAVNGPLPFFIPQLDVAAHVGGFGAGLLCAALLCRDQAALHSQRPPRPVALLALAVIVGSGLALARVAAAGSASRTPHHVQLAQALLQASERGAPAPWLGGVLNGLAWHWAVAPAPSTAELSVARRAAERALTLAPDSHATLDTLATVAYRQRDYERASTAERRAEQLAPQRFYRSQLARFLAAHWRQSGVLRWSPGSTHTRATLVPLAGTAGAGELQVELTLEGASARGAELWFLVQVREQLAGVAVVRVGPEAPDGAPRTLTLQGVERDAPAIRLELAAIDLDGCQACSPGSLEGSYQAMDPAALALP